MPPLGAIPLAHHPPAGSAFAAPLAASSDNNLPDKIQSAFAASVPNPIERRIRNDFLLQQQSVSHFNIDQRLAETKLAEALTLSLLDGEWRSDSAVQKHIGLTATLFSASAVCCCSRMPALQILVDRIPFYKNSLYSLDAAGQVRAHAWRSQSAADPRAVSSFTALRRCTVRSRRSSRSSLCDTGRAKSRIVRRFRHATTLSSSRRTTGKGLPHARNPCARASVARWRTLKRLVGQRQEFGRVDAVADL